MYGVSPEATLDGMKGNVENEKKRDGALWTRIVCVKVLWPSVVGRDV